jgi:hypothetical protein
LTGVFNFLGQTTGVDGFDPNMAAFNPTAEENEFTKMLQQRAAGQGGPSPAELQMQRALGQSQAQAQSMAASQRGIAPGLAARLASQQQAQMSQDIAGQSGILRAQEQLGSQELLSNIFESQRRGRAAGEEARRGAYEEQAKRAQQFMSNAGQMAARGATGGAGGKPFAYGGAVVDSPANDTVPAMLSPGEIVVPKSVVQMGPDASAQFVAALSRYVK